MRKSFFTLAVIGVIVSIVATSCQSAIQQESSIDGTIQSGVSDILKKHLKEFDAEAGKVIVVETTTGKVRVMEDLTKNDNEYETSYNFFEYCHNSGLGQGVSLLAILEKGVLTLDSKIDTGNGEYIRKEYGDTIFDHNWHHGGYGKMTLRDVFSKCSNVGMVRAIEQSFSNPNGWIEQERKIIDEDGAPNSFTGYTQGWQAYYYLLDFYNAIANNGKMIVTSDKEDSVIVANPQIAKAENIDSMKSVLRYFVTDGIAKKANSDKVKIAGACATKKMDNGSIYGDFIGYFPADKPKYTVFVSLKRNSSPMSAGGMCGPIFKAIAEYLCNPNVNYKSLKK